MVLGLLLGIPFFGTMYEGWFLGRLIWWRFSPLSGDVQLICFARHPNLAMLHVEVTSHLLELFLQGYLMRRTVPDWSEPDLNISEPSWEVCNCRILMDTAGPFKLSPCFTVTCSRREVLKLQSLQHHGRYPAKDLQGLRRRGKTTVFHNVMIYRYL